MELLDWTSGIRGFPGLTRDSHGYGPLVDDVTQKLTRTRLFSRDNFLQNLLIGEPESGAGAMFRELLFTAYASASASTFAGIF